MNLFGPVHSSVHQVKLFVLPFQVCSRSYLLFSEAIGPKCPTSSSLSPICFLRQAPSRSHEVRTTIPDVSCNAWMDCHNDSVTESFRHGQSLVASDPPGFPGPGTTLPRQPLPSLLALVSFSRYVSLLYCRSFCCVFFLFARLFICSV